MANGDVLVGESIGAPGLVTGDMVFHTAMAGYQETLSDPGYRGQLVTMTYPHMGNTGVNAHDAESDQLHAAGLIIKNLSPVASSFMATDDLAGYLREHKTVAIAGIDTRQVTAALRDGGSQAGAILALPAGEAATPEQIDKARAAARDAAQQAATDLVQQVSTRQPYAWAPDDGPGDAGVSPRFKVLAWDFGVRRSMLRALAARGCEITVLPADADVAQALAGQPDGVFLSGGPGDPAACTAGVAAATALLASGLPVLGIGLGHQLMALAAGARTYKTGRSHRGINHPVRNLKSGQVSVTGQSHSWAVDRESLPDSVQATHVSLFDGTLQGLQWRGVPAHSFQGTPDPAVHDASQGDDILGRFVASMQENAA